MDNKQQLAISRGGWGRRQAAANNKEVDDHTINNDESRQRTIEWVRDT
jgi:hypothetical protein